MRRFAFVLALVACGDSAPPPKAVPVCTTSLPPRAPVPAPLPPTPPPAMTRPSRIVAHVELKLAPIVKELEAKIAPRLADEKDKPAGAAGHLDYTVDRGPFRASVEHDALVIRTDIRAHAEACKNRSCYASCSPEGTATATVPLRLGPDYRFAPSHVAFAFTKGCEVKVLGGFLRIDVTPTIGAQIEPQLRRVEQQIDASVPPMRPQAEKLWTELGKARTLPLGPCAIIHPRGLVEGPIAGTPEAMQVRLGLIAYPEIRSGGSAACASESPGPLPPLAQDPSMPPEDDAIVALVSPLAGVNIVGGAVTRAAIAQSADKAQLDVTHHGESCGDATLLTSVEWAEDKSSLRFAAPEVKARTWAPAIAPTALPSAVPMLASSMSDPSVSVSAKVTDVKPLDVVLRNGDIVAYIAARGSIGLAQK
jgi:hypothetical protein